MKRKLQCQFLCPSRRRSPELRAAESYVPAEAHLVCGTIPHYHPWTLPVTEAKNTHNGILLDVEESSGNFGMILRRSPAEKELIQHFERFTSKVLALSPTIWERLVLKLAFKESYFMLHSRRCADYRVG